MTSSRAPETATARRWVMLVTILAALFCWGVALVIGGTSGIVLALLGLLGLVSGTLSLRRTGGSDRV
jgi:hypothetical protein